MINFTTPPHILRMGPDATYIFEERVCIACEGSGLNQPTSEIVIMATRAAMDCVEEARKAKAVSEGRLF